MSSAAEPEHPRASRRTLERFLSEVRGVLSSRQVLTARAQLASFESDALTAFRCRPQAVLIVETQDQVVECVRLCHRYSVPFVARGSGTSLSGGSLPVADGVVLALNRLRRIHRVDAQNRLAVVEPGVVNLEVSRAAAPFGLYYAPDPSSQQVCTIGGNLAFNAGGAHCLKHGMTSNHILGLKVVLPDGEVVDLGGQSLEGISADWPGLFVGSEGLFGIALEATLRLVPKPECTYTLLAAYRELRQAGDAVAQVILSGLLPGAMEVMDRLAIEAAEAAVAAGYPQDAGGLLLVELEGDEAEVAADARCLDDLIRRSRPYEIRVAESEAQKAAIWKGRKSAFSAVGRLAPDYLVQDGVVPRSRLGDVLAEIEQLSATHQLRVANVFHAGDGNLHPLILFDGRRPGELERAEQLAAEILRRCLELGGSITGEHGVGVEKREFLGEMFGPQDLEVMWRLKSAIDPEGLANPGKMLPERQRAPAGQGSGLQRDAVSAIAEAVARSSRLRFRAGGSKRALHPAAGDFEVVDLSPLRGVLEYRPEELTLTALAATPVLEIENCLAEEGQYLPCDPLLAEAGSTLGGTLATGANGPGRYRYGGIRDFVLGVELIDGRGERIRSGGRVVKNAAGFDLSKFVVGSRGRFGAVAELTVKVFPRPLRRRTLCLRGDGDAARSGALALLASGASLECLDYEAPETVWVRLSGRNDEVLDRLEARAIDTAHLDRDDCLEADEDERHWRLVRELAWAGPEASVFKVAIVPTLLDPLEASLVSLEVKRWYSGGCQQLWLSAPSTSSDWVAVASVLDRHALRVFPLLGQPVSALQSLDSPATIPSPFEVRVRQALDPRGRFV